MQILLYKLLFFCLLEDKERMSTASLSFTATDVEV